MAKIEEGKRLLPRDFRLFSFEENGGVWNQLGFR